MNAVYIKRDYDHDWKYDDQIRQYLGYIDVYLFLLVQEGIFKIFFCVMLFICVAKYYKIKKYLVNKDPSYNLGQNLIWGVIIAASLGTLEVIICTGYMVLLSATHFEKYFNLGMLWFVYTWSVISAFTI